MGGFSVRNSASARARGRGRVRGRVRVYYSHYIARLGLMDGVIG